MKKYYQIALVALVCLFSFQVTACADNDKPIDFTQLPTAAQQLVKNTYEGSTILSIEKERNEYEIHLANGLEITFNSKFQVIDID